MSQPKSLLQMAGADPKPSALSESVLVIIDAQNEYSTGALPLYRIDDAVATLKSLLARARRAGAGIVHIAHKGRQGGLFDRGAGNGRIMDALAPRDGEKVIEKGLPNAFAATELDDVLKAGGSKPLLIAGFMTHMCVSSTARAALDHGFSTTIAADACATRDLPNPLGGAVSAQSVHEAALAGLADRFACVTLAADIPD